LRYSAIASLSWPFNEGAEFLGLHFVELVLTKPPAASAESRDTLSLTAVVGWVIAQIATQIFPFLEIPNCVVRLVIVLIAIGFPIALIIAWAFEATPQGIKRTEVADATPELPDQGSPARFKRVQRRAIAHDRLRRVALQDQPKDAVVHLIVHAIGSAEVQPF
jgi:hypothetical protein